MKKLFCITLVFVFLLAALPQASFAADIAAFKLSDGATIYYGRKNLVHEICVPIRLLNLQNVFGAQAKLTFDTKISILGITPGNIFDGKDYYEPGSELGISSARYGATIQGDAVGVSAAEKTLADLKLELDGTGVSGRTDGSNSAGRSWYLCRTAAFRFQLRLRNQRGGYNSGNDYFSG